ncbi:MAG TPA: hypothetical protein DHV42_04705 [Lachnospiraceae bacterium]|nr:hypothetical protein [Lachnospiraceae bacterium]
MQYSSIELKSTQYALTLVMDPASPFETILEDVRKKFLSSARFFKGAQMALEFSGKQLSPSEQSEVVSAITQSCGLEIICILEKDEEAEQAQYTAITEVLKDRSVPKSPGQESVPGRGQDPMAKGTGPENAGYADVLHGTVKNGQKVLSDRSVLILGDVEPLAEVSCAGSVFVAGCALGTLRAGLGDNAHSFAAALVLKPQNLEVCGHRGITGIRKKTMDDSYSISPQAAFVEDGHLKLTGISGKMWSHLFGKVPGKTQNAKHSELKAE